LNGIDPKAADHEYPIRLFSKLHYSPAVFFRGDKVEVGHFGHCMTNGLVKCAFRRFTTMNMRHRNSCR
jgi:hypothetical protein